jgi:CRISPR-associated protein Cas2
MESARRYLVAYDVSVDLRRGRIAKTLERFGDRVQYSVFVVDVRPAKLVRLRTELEQLMKADDSILIADLGVLATLDARRFEFLGRRRDLRGSGPIVL